MKLTVKPTRRMHGRFRVPADCGLAQRAAVLSLLCSGRSTINNWPGNDAAHATLECVRKLGGTINVDGSVVEIEGKAPADLSPAESELDCQDADTTFWLLAGLLSGGRFPSTLTCGAGPTVDKKILEALGCMGAIIDSTETSRQIKITPAKLQGTEITTRSVLPYQKSAVLMAGLIAGSKTVLTEKLPLPDNLERILPAYGIELDIARPPRPLSRREAMLAGVETDVEKEKYHKRITITTATEQLRPVDWVLPGDFSLAAPLVAACSALPGSEIQIEDVALNSTRTGLLKVLKRMGAQITTHRRRMENNEPTGDISVVGDLLKPTKITPAEIPSLVAELPLLAVVAGSAVGVTVIRGAAELHDADILSLSTITENLRRMGVKVAELEDGWAIEGPTEWRSAEIDCDGNTSIGMAFAVAGLFANDDTIIENAESVISRFPDLQMILLSFSSAL